MDISGGPLFKPNRDGILAYKDSHLSQMQNALITYQGSHVSKASTQVQNSIQISIAQGSQISSFKSSKFCTIEALDFINPWAEFITIIDL